MKVAVTTGGGDCPGINAVIRALVQTLVRKHGATVVGIPDGFNGLLDPVRLEPLTDDSVKGLHVRGGTILGANNRGNPFQFTVGGKTIDRSGEVLENYKKAGIDCLVAIGGDGTMGIVDGMMDRGIKAVGVPKTIDNDLSATDVTFGFDTAVETATYAIDKLQTTAESHHRVIYVEVMGRDSGFIALHAGLAGGADVVLIPEIPFRTEYIAAKVNQRAERGSRHSIIVVAEGARTEGGEQQFHQIDPATGKKRLGGMAERVAEAVGPLTKQEWRVTVLGHIQRGGIPNPHDRVLCTRLGAAAAEAVNARAFGMMVAVRGTQIIRVPIKEAIHQIKKVDPKGELVQCAKGLGMSFGDEPPRGGSAGKKA